MVPIVWTESANSDLINIKKYVSLDSVLQAGLLIEAIYRKAQILSKTDIFVLSVHHSARLLRNNPHFKDLLQ